MDAARIVEDKNIQSLDFDTCSLALGITRDGNPPWMQLDRWDLLIIAKALHKCGATESSQPLRLLAKWCEAAADHIRRHSDE